MNLIQKYFDAFNRFSENEAFSLNDEKLTYNEFSRLINGSRNLLAAESEFHVESVVGVLCDARPETYATVFAIWFSGAVFVPLNPGSPDNINKQLIQKYNIKFVFGGKQFLSIAKYLGAKLLCNYKAESTVSLPLFEWKDEQVMYILNTSGSTGTPKNVLINLKNVTSFADGFLALYPELDSSDKFLQTYELTSDAAFTGYLIPFLLGATVYTVPAGQFKPFAVAKILSEKTITWVQVTPSLLACLQPFFSSLYLPGITHFHFGGEALPADMLEKWRTQIPNAEISNVYGPTETTITSTIYKCLPGQNLKAKNNVVSIGQPMKHVRIRISNEQGINGASGELLIGGNQVMDGYLFTEEQPFKLFTVGEQTLRFYPSGDLVQKDDDGYLYYCGRIDDQVKISGYRVDLIEIENKIRTICPDNANVVALAVEKSPGMKQLVVFIENYKGNGEEIMNQLSTHFPLYKVPEKVIGIPQFPLASSGKVDKKALISQFWEY